VNRFSLIAGAAGTLLLLFVAIPVIRMILAADPAILAKTMAEPGVVASIFLTLKCAFFATMVCALFGIPLAFILARRDFFGKSIVSGIIDLPVMIPHTAAGIALLMVFGKRFFIGKAFAHAGIGFVGTEAGISLAMAFVSLPFLVNSARDGFSAIDPRLERVAETLGASASRTFFSISLPLAFRPILSGLIMMWARGISEFGAVIILAYHPMTAPVLIWERFTSFGLAYARPVAVLLILICLVIFSVLRFIGKQQRDA